MGLSGTGLTPEEAYAAVLLRESDDVDLAGSTVELGRWTISDDELTDAPPRRATVVHA